jgi:Cof subfamily protein (haloacid dehalogenase superfamily)
LYFRPLKEQPLEKIQLIATDLDGTFLNNDKSISASNLSALKLLGRQGIIRVAATGRNLRKVDEVIPREVPFDYVVFSSGAGVINWQTQELLLKQNIPAHQASEITRFLISKRVNFNAYRAVPENHSLWFHQGGGPCEEFERYFAYHHSFADPLPLDKSPLETLCQFLVILPNNPDLFYELKRDMESGFPEIGVIRSTSPLGTGFIWMEVFNRKVSKGNAIAFLCDRLAIPQDQTLGIGNDYNDLHLLDFTHHSFMVENAMEELKVRYQAAPSNEDNAFSFAVSRFLKQ